MTTIEDKIKLFSKIIYDQINEEKQRGLEEFDKQKKIILDEKRKACAERSREILTEAAKRASIKGSETVSKERMNALRETMALREALIEDTSSNLKNMLLDYIETREYGELLISQAKAVFLSLKPGQYVVYLSQKDYYRYKDIVQAAAGDFKGTAVRVEAADREMLGGLIIEEMNRKFRIDNSLDTRLGDWKQHIGQKVMEYLNRG